MKYAQRLAELMLAAFVAGAAPVFYSEGLTQAGIKGALTAGVVAVYGLLVKKLGDPERPSAL